MEPNRPAEEDQDFFQACEMLAMITGPRRSLHPGDYARPIFYPLRRPAAHHYQHRGARSVRPRSHARRAARRGLTRAGPDPDPDPPEPRPSAVGGVA